MNSTAQHPKAANSGIIEAQARLKAHQDEIARLSAAAEPIAKAISECRNRIAARDTAQRRVDELRAARRKLVADEYTGKGDGSALRENTKALDAARAATLRADAEAANSEDALPELETRYQAAMQPLQRLAAETPRLQAELLARAADVMLDEYGVHACSLYDKFLELVALAQRINAFGRQAGLAPVQPEVPMQLEVPAITVGAWKLRNPLNANAQQFNEAQQRLAAKLRELGITGV